MCASFAPAPISGRLKKGFAALEIYNYFEAKKQFTKALKKDSVAAGYGLSVIFGRNDNPFYQIDSAYKYIQIARELYPDLNQKTKEKYAALNVDSIAIVNQSVHVDSLFFEVALLENTISGWEKFIEEHNTKHLRKQAEANRNQLAFKLATEENTASSYKDFMKTYPDAAEVVEAEKKYHLRLYEEETKGGKIRDYQRFLENYPESPYASDAQYKVYERSTAPGTLEVFKQFIDENPKNENVNRAWRNIYALEIGELNAKSIAAFSLKYPDYPFAEELKMDFRYATTPYYPVEQNGLWGFIDNKGNLKINPEYDWVEPFKENIAAVGQDDKVGFITKAGNLIGNIEFEDTYGFKNGYAVVAIDEKYGAINRLGKWIIPAVYEDLGEFSDGFFYAENEEGYGYIDENGKIAIDFVFENATDFQNGLAVVQKDGKYGVVNTKGNLVSNFEFDWIQPFQTNRYPSKFKLGEKFGLIDQAGVVIVDSIYTQIGDFSEGLALAANGNKYGYINTRGDTIIDFKYDFTPEVLRFSKVENGYIRISQNKKVGVIDTLGNRVFPAIFDNIGEFKGKLIPVMKNNKWGYADLNVNLAIPYKFDEVSNFKDSVAVVSSNGKFGVIDTLGKTVVDLTFNALLLIDTLALVSDTAYGLIDLNQNEIIPLVYESAEVVDHQIILFKTSDGKLIYYDYRRKEFIWREKSE